MPISAILGKSTVALSLACAAHLSADPVSQSNWDPSLVDLTQSLQASGFDPATTETFSHGFTAVASQVTVRYKLDMGGYLSTVGIYPLSAVNSAPDRISYAISAVQSAQIFFDDRNQNPPVTTVLNVLEGQDYGVFALVNSSVSMFLADPIRIANGEQGIIFLDPRQNLRGDDHFLTFFANGRGVASGFEDLYQLGDKDYNDGQFWISGFVPTESYQPPVIPEASTIAAGAVGAAAVGFSLLRRRTSGR